MSNVNCPRCGNLSTGLLPVEEGLRTALKDAGVAENLPADICGTCYAQLSASVGRGGMLLAREKAKEQNKLMLWKSRVNLIKKARNHMVEKAFSEAAVAYEKYIRVLEIVFDVEKGQLSPELFKDSARTPELTVVASVYWDLMRIYDTSDKYLERQQTASKKLTQFLKFTPIYPDIMRKAESFAKSAKNPVLFKSFVKSSAQAKGRCFIATSAFDNWDAPEVLYLQGFRDHVLMNSAWGQALVDCYYRYSPPLAFFIDEHPSLKYPVQWGLRKFVTLLEVRNLRKNDLQ